MKKIFILFLLFSFHLTTFTHAATAPSGGGGRWVDKTLSRVGLDDIIEATARQQAVRNGSSVTLEAVVRETVKRQAVGKVLLQRILGGGIAVAGITALIEGIGWVMENGQYVKYKRTDDKLPDVPLVWVYLGEKDKLFETAESACKAQFPQNPDIHKWRYSRTVMTTLESADCMGFSPETPESGKDTKNTGVSKIKNPNYDPKAPPPEKIVLTDKLTGDIAVGDYTDPVNSSKDKKDRVWTDVTSAYENDPNGIGNELSDALDDKMDNAPETTTKPSKPPETDGAGQKYPTDKDKGTEGTTEQDKDPTTGQPTGSGSFNLPKWCLWAADNCEWHKEDKAHQTQEKTVWEDEKKHRGDEKTFWQKVTDFFDWVKEEPEKDNEQEQPDIDDKGIFSKTFDYVFSLSKQCPPDIPINFETKFFSGSFVFSLKWLCMIFTFLGYPLVFASHCTGVWILYEAVIRKEFRW